MTSAFTASVEADSLLERVAELESALRAEKELVVKLIAERDLLLASHARLRLELDLLKRRIFVAKAERVDTVQLELEFAGKLAELDAIAGTLGMGKPELPLSELADPNTPAKPGSRPKPKGRRNLKDANLREERIEIADPLFEDLILTGKAKRISFEESRKLAYKRGGQFCLVVARVTYRLLDSKGAATLETAPMPAETFPRLLAAPSMLAHIAHDKHGRGLPLFRIEEEFKINGVPVDRGTMCRWLEDLGATLGATVIHAARDHAMRTAFCIATDATGICIQPIRTQKKKRQACHKGHFFVCIADKDHVFFEYQRRETSAVVSEMFRGFRGYLQADAKSVYDLLYRGCDDDPPDHIPPSEVGCWSHARRKYWEAAAAKCTVAREALVRIGRIFELDASFQTRAPAEIKRLRQVHLRPHVEDFFAWAQVQYEKVKDQRGMLRSAFGYSVRQKQALLRFLDDGRLVMTNNRSELQLRKIATGRKAWLFCGSDDHAESAGHILSLIASARMHGLDAEAYLRDLVRVLAHWPKGRYLELAPLFWRQTRARLDPVELEREIGVLTVPPRLPATQQQAAAG